MKNFFSILERVNVIIKKKDKKSYFTSSFV